MSTRPRYHTQQRRVQDGGEDIRGAIRALARLLNTEKHHDERRSTSWRGQQPRWMPRRQPHRFDGPPPNRMFWGTSGPQRWPPYFHGDPRLGSNGQWNHTSQRGYDWRPLVLPRRGPPVAVQRVPTMVPTRGEGKEAASWGKTPRHSAGRPRKDSQ